MTGFFVQEEVQATITMERIQMERSKFPFKAMGAFPLFSFQNGLFCLRKRHTQT